MAEQIFQIFVRDYPSKTITIEVYNNTLIRDVIDIVEKITPVPGGVGPMTIACLMHNTLKAAFLNKKDNFIDIIEGIS